MTHRNLLLRPRLVQAERLVHHLFDKRDAIELDELHVRLHPTVQRKAHLPGPRKHLWILDRGFVLDVIRADWLVALDDMKLVAMKVSRSIEPRVRFEARHVDN